MRRTRFAQQAEYLVPDQQILCRPDRAVNRHEIRALLRANPHSDKAAGKHEAIQLAEHYERMAMALHHRDADFHQHDVAAALAQANALRNLVGSRTRRDE